MGRSSAPPIEIEVIRNPDRFREIESEWTRALERYESRTLFVSFPWIEAWWSAFDQTVGVHCLVARAEGRILGMAPMMIERRRVGLGRVRVLRFLGNELSPRSDLVLVERRSEVLDAFVDSLRELPWTFFDCGRLPVDSPALPALRTHVGGAFSSIRPRREYRVPCVDLTGSWEEYLKGQSRNFRRGRRRDEAKVSGCEFRHFPGEITDPDRALEDLRSISEETWAHRAHSGLASADRTWALYERLLRSSSPSGHAGVSFLHDGNEPVSFLIWMKDGRTLYYLKQGYRMSSADRAPGANLLAATLRRSFRDHPGCVVDLECAVLDSDYKLRWGNTERRAVASYVFRPRLSSRVLGGLLAMKQGLRIPVRMSSR